MHVTVSTLACTVLVLFTAWFFEMPLERAIVAAPLIVVSAGAAVGIVVLWTKVIVESVRSRRSP